MNKLEFGNPDHIAIARKAELVAKLVKEGNFTGIETEKVCGGCGYPLEYAEIVKDGENRYFMCTECDKIIEQLDH